MQTNPSVLAIIPARGGSKGLPRKNILEAGGLPLIAWTINAGLRSKYVTRVVLSSDDDEIMAVARQYGCDVPFKRPAELAADQTPSIAVILHALELLPHYDYVVLLQPTSPLRTARDIDASFEQMKQCNAQACVSLSLVGETPYWMYTLNESCQLKALLEQAPGAYRRQDCPPVYSLNGAVYIANTSWLKRNQTFLSPETVGYVMPENRSIDIDTMDDFDKFKKVLTEKTDG
jgi:N-acylneuraminate cytidylyltransferase